MFKVFLAVFLAAAVSSAAAAAPVRLVLDGREVAPDVPPDIRNGVAMVPVRFVGDHLGYAASWDTAAREAVISGSGKRITLRAGSRSATVSGKVLPLTRPAEITGGRVMVPLRFVAESLGAQVAWDGERRRISISRKPAALETTNIGPQMTPDGIPQTQFTLPPDIFQR